MPGLGDGRRYSAASAAKERAAWPVVLRRVPSLSETQGRQVIKTWLDNGVLMTGEYHDPVERKECRGPLANPAKRPGSNAR